MLDFERLFKIGSLLIKGICVSSLAYHVVSFIVLKALFPDAHQHVVDAHVAEVLGSGVCSVVAYVALNERIRS